MILPKKKIIIIMILRITNQLVILSPFFSYLGSTSLKSIRHLLKKKQHEPYMVQIFTLLSLSQCYKLLGASMVIPRAKIQGHGPVSRSVCIGNKFFFRRSKRSPRHRINAATFNPSWDPKNSATATLRNLTIFRQYL